MLLEFTVKNYKSFKDAQTLSLIATKDDAHPEALIHPDPKVFDGAVLKCVGIFGPNASGKSNLVAALGQFRRLIRDAYVGDRVRDVSYTPFRLDSESQNAASVFELHFIYEDRRFAYEVGISRRTQVESERLLEYSGSRRHRTLFERSEPNASTMRFPAWEGRAKEIAEQTRTDRLFLSTAAQLNHPFAWSLQDGILGQVKTADSMPSMWGSLDTTSRLGLTLAMGSRDVHERIQNFIRHADLGLSEVRIIDHADPGKPMMTATQTGSDGVGHDLQSQSHSFEPRFIHQGAGTDGLTVEAEFGYYEESEGTQALYSITTLLLDALHAGRTVALDELGSNFHSALSAEIVSAFSSAKNTTGAQLIFTSHDTTLMDLDLLRRDQIWLTSKGRSGATSLYSLSDLKGVRKDLDVQANYLAGRFGAVPFLDDLFRGEGANEP
ncbi:MAG: ATP-binding protein [bacterium]